MRCCNTDSVTFTLVGFAEAFAICGEPGLLSLPLQGHYPVSTVVFGQIEGFVSFLKEIFS